MSNEQQVTPEEQAPPPPTEVQQPPDGSAPVAAPVPVTAPPGPAPDPDGVVVPAANETTATVTRPGDPGYDELVAEGERQQQRARDLEGRE